jgi:HEAT repeat protein
MPFVQGLFGPPNIEKMKARGDVEGLVKALDYQKDSGVRRAAALALGDTGDGRSIEPLITALKDRGGAVYEAAAEALGKIGGARAVEPLIAALKDDDPRMRKAAAEALGKIGKPGVEPLIAALKDDNWRVREAAVKLLGKFGDARGVEPLVAALRDSQLYVSKEAVNALDLLGWRPGTDEDGARYWSLKDEWDPCIEIGAQAVEPLIVRLKQGSLPAMEALWKIGDARAVEPVIAILKHVNWAWRTAAAEALGKMGDVRAVEPLTAALKDDTWKVSQAAAEALGAIGDARAVESLTAILKDYIREVRAEHEAFLKSKDMRAILNDSKRAEREAARKAACEAAVGALGEIGDGRAVEPLITALDNYVPKASAEALVKIGKPAVETLIAELQDNNRHVPEQVIEVLSKIGDTRAVEPLVAALKDQDNDVRKAAAGALGMIGDPRAVEPLVAALKDHDANVRKAAARALGLIGDTRAIGPLTGDPSMPEAMVEGLGMTGDAGAIDLLISFLKTPAVVSRAAEVLEKLGAPAVEALCSALKKDALALPRHPPESPMPGAYVEGENLYWARVRFRQSIVGILGSIADARAVETLTWVSRNDPSVVNLLENEEIAARDDTWPVREAARDALEKIAGVARDSHPGASPTGRQAS